MEKLHVFRIFHFPSLSLFVGVNYKTFCFSPGIWLEKLFLLAF